MGPILSIARMRVVAAFAVWMLSCAGAALGEQSPSLKGRSLQDALQILQHEGLRIVFSSEAVTADMRVIEEPRAQRPRAKLDELLKPHGLKAVSGPGPIIQIIADRGGAPRTTSRARGAAATLASPSLGENEPRAYSEAVLVRAESEDREPVGSNGALDFQHLQSSRGAIDDVLQAVQMLPRVASVDDYRGEFSVRGSPYRHVGSVIDGIATPWLRHSVYGRSDLGSLSMLSSEGLQSATLHTGAYPQRYGDRLGAELELTLREGSRESRRFHGSVGGTALAVVAEGPLGRERRGSWIVGMRNSYLDWPVKRRVVGGSAFAFADAHAKLVYDVSPSQQLTFTALGGRSRLDTPDDVAAGGLVSGTNDAMLLSAGWRSSLASRGVVRQSVAVIDQQLSNTIQSGRTAGGARDRLVIYHAEAMHTLAGGRFEAGADVSSLHGVRELSDVPPGFAIAPSEAAATTIAADWWTRSAYVHFDRTVSRDITLGAGVRVASSTLVEASRVSPWLLSQWRFRPGWAVNTSVGVAHQFPDLEFVRPGAGTPLAPERATHVDVGVERRVAGVYRWQATFFDRQERDLVDDIRVVPQVVGGLVTPAGVLRDYQNTLSGRSRGIELILAREGTTRLMGWISYAYGRTRQTDAATHETFWADFDRRHALSAVGMYRLTPSTTVELDVRASTNVPIAGYLSSRDGVFVAGTARNAIRLPFYARLDARVQRTFGSSFRRVSVFGEVLNLLDRRNLGPAEGAFDAHSGEAIGFTRELMPRRVSVGVAVHF